MRRLGVLGLVALSARESTPSFAASADLPEASAASPLTRTRHRRLYSSL
jgi:hypothetical protein